LPPASPGPKDVSIKPATIGAPNWLARAAAARSSASALFQFELRPNLWVNAGYAAAAKSTLSRFALGAASGAASATPLSTDASAVVELCEPQAGANRTSNGQHEYFDMDYFDSAKQQRLSGVGSGCALPSVHHLFCNSARQARSYAARRLPSTTRRKAAIYPPLQ